jgi:hypothetical protein
MKAYGRVKWLPAALSPGVKRPEHEDGHSLPASAEVNKIWIYDVI